jgi:YcxB-like protein
VITVRFTLSQAEARHAMRYMVLRSRAPSLMLLVGLAMLAIALATHKSVWFGVAGAELLAWLGLIVLIPRLGLRTTGGEQTVSFSDEGVTAANAGGSQRFPWEHWRLWRRTGDLYLLRGAGSIFTFIPARAFGSPDTESEFCELLARRVSGRSRSSR